MTHDRIESASLCSIRDLASALALSRAGVYRVLQRDARAPAKLKVLGATRFAVEDVERYVRELKEEAERQRSGRLAASDVEAVT